MTIAKIGAVDIAPLVERVMVRGLTFEIGGIEIASFTQLIFEFPELRALIEKRAFKIEALMALPDQVLVKLIAAGMGARGDAKAETNIANFAIGEKADLLAGIVRASMPEGVDPFERLASALGLDLDSLVAGNTTPAAAASPAETGRFKLRATRSARPSIESSAPAIN